MRNELSGLVKQAKRELETLQQTKKVIEEPVQILQDEYLAKSNVPHGLKCPICLNVYEDRIQLCCNGHSMCGKCYDNPAVNRCPSCRGLLCPKTVRNRSLEELVGCWRMTCPFQDKGCNVMIMCVDLNKHFDVCPYGKPEERQKVKELEQEIRVRESEMKVLEFRLKMLVLRKVL